MRSLSLIIFGLLGLTVLVIGLTPPKSPHGEDFDISCSVCHSTKGWKLDKEIYSFDHDQTALPLEGQHVDTDCRMCHPTLIFSEAGNQCVDCHTDIHNQNVGMDCARCHSPESWLVGNIMEIHEMSRFPLLGAHATADCYDCHLSENFLTFEPLGIECLDCHQEDFLSTTMPDHTAAGFSTDCQDCHNIFAFEWGSSGFNHAFFPLVQGHDIQECQTCHASNDFSGLTAECFSCHEADFNATQNPNHQLSGFSTNCKLCHNLNPGWRPAQFDHDGPYFPIYSGKHRGTWNNCTDCHTNPSNYAVFSCIDCHEHNQAEMDSEHDEVSNYVFNSINCFNCHPRGDEG